MHASNGILFNHESPRRGETFVTRKITRAVARIAAGKQSELYLGNLDARRDWGYAPEYVVAMWRMLQLDEPQDLVVATGDSLTVQDFLEASFSMANLDWKNYVRFDEQYLRPAEVDSLIGDASKAEAALNWKATVGPTRLAEIMVEHDMALLNGNVVDVPRSALWDFEVAQG
jgi:GDPmannose 4,6-dehydratase